MRLIRLYIKENGILRDFTLEFPQKPENNISVFIGENGSGKTTVMESITKIFSWFIKGEKPLFEFELEYQIHLEEADKTTYSRECQVDYIMVKLYANKNIVDIECKIGETVLNNLTEIRSSKDLTAMKQTIKDNKFKLLPDAIAIYYAGESTNIKKIVETHNKGYSEAIRELYDKESHLDPHLFFYYEPFHFNLIFLALLSYEYGNVPEFLKRKLQFQSINYFTVNLKKPHWAKGKLDLDKYEFWGAKGQIAVFLRQLVELASKIEETKNSALLYFYGENKFNLHKLRDLYGTEKEFFTILEMAWLNDLIESIDVSIIKQVYSQNFPVNSNSFSEGEKQALIILGMNELVLKENSLALFDEPDTYLHPQWQRDFIEELESYIAISTSNENEYIITSHSPNIVAGIKKENLFVFKDGQTKEIPFNSYGKNVESVLLDFFNVDGVRNKYVENLLVEVQEMVKNKQYESPEFKNKYQELNNILSPTAPEIVNINLEISRNLKR